MRILFDTLNCEFSGYNIESDYLAYMLCILPSLFQCFLLPSVLRITNLYLWYVRLLNSYWYLLFIAHHTTFLPYFHFIQIVLTWFGRNHESRTWQWKEQFFAPCGHSGNNCMEKVWLCCRIWDSHSGGYEEFYLLGYNAMRSVESQPTFQRNMPPPSSE
jgi:hypothetical protein